ncbi:hypothetical protein [Pseudomarimonas salicorniae]|uniref:Cytochrome c domain-containing protein n=1 Tax=Pseudomarimonas salicorniae TaxID=2933270 RepID=A0ABT0GL58_9GAMM|nr:hypothetical protein [Lysobacter sp. CAU 1642]MCK7594765.1 hypothetical protein [Lysobacter sp. CAU 1642]
MGSRLAAMVGLAVALLAAPAARAAWPAGCEDLSGEPINFNVDWQTDIKPIINESISAEGRCTSCHNMGQMDGNLDLTDQGIDAVHKIVGIYVLPGDPQGSVLFQKVNCDSPPSGGTRMPASAPGFAGVPLSFAQQALIYDWIAQGAPGKDPNEASEPPKDFLFRDGVESLR